MKHSSHQHALILNEVYIARDGDICRGCSEKIFSYNSFVYSCSRIIGAGTSTDASVDDNSCASFLLHKNCAELPESIQNPANPKELLRLCVDHTFSKYLRFLERASFSIECDICDMDISWSPKQFFYYRRKENSNIFDGYVCLNCVMFRTQMSLGDRKFRHQAHEQHLLSLIQQPSSFKCHACNVEDNIKHMSYRCTECQFWVHKSCAEAPRTFQFQFHDKHPLILSFFLPKLYRKFEQYCGLCNKKLSRLVWIYYCPKCRFFAHFKCARSFNGVLNAGENENYDSDVEQLPAPDELSVTLLREKFIKAWSTQNNNGSLLSSGDVIEHWTHKEHPLQLITVNELKNQLVVDELSLLCDGCIQSIRMDEGQFYGCVSCKFFMHKFCAELPKRMKVDIGPAGLYANANKHSEPYKLFYCRGCGEGCNGIFFNLAGFNFHIGCVTLPKMIKHEAHRHKLTRVFVREPKDCKACYRLILMNVSHKCEQCDYRICGSCIMKPSLVKHPWDPHPLRLIYKPSMVSDHEHDFNCEFCSKDIDTNYWFYHCSDCDISFHLFRCFENSSHRDYLNLKFGATGIVIDKLHHHSLTFVLNKKLRKCEKCQKNQLGEPVLECAGPCRSIFCISCIERQ